MQSGPQDVATGPPRHRLYLADDLSAGREVALPRETAHHAVSVLRLPSGEPLLLFNGRDGEWRGELRTAGRREASVLTLARTRPQPAPSPVRLMFAPLKHARLDYLVQKATEMGAGEIAPVLTRRTHVARVNLDRMRSNVIEAAQQCGVLALPDVRPERRLEAALAELGPDRLLVFCDEEAPEADPVAALRAAAPDAAGIDVLIGPEGGFDPAERAALLGRPALCRLSLGPRILRADTAIVAALALVQAVRGDGRPGAAALQAPGRSPM